MKSDCKNATEIDYLMLAYACLDQAGENRMAKELLKRISQTVDHAEGTKTKGTQ